MQMFFGVMIPLFCAYVVFALLVERVIQSVQQWLKRRHRDSHTTI